MTLEDASQLCFDQVPMIAKNLPVSYWQGSVDWQQRVRLLFTDEERFKSQIDAFMHENENRLRCAGQWSENVYPTI